MKRMWSKEELTEEIAGGPVETLDVSKFSLIDSQAKVTASNAYRIGDMGIVTIESITSADTGGRLRYDGKDVYGSRISDQSRDAVFYGNLSVPEVVIFQIP